MPNLISLVILLGFSQDLLSIPSNQLEIIQGCFHVQLLDLIGRIRPQCKLRIVYSMLVDRLSQSPNDSVVRVGIIQEEFHRHKHDLEDEFFYVIEGRLFIDLEEETIELKPKQG
ncbi:MAG: cupin domain-containing protein [Promethearchaeota archaeon]